MKVNINTIKVRFESLEPSLLFWFRNASHNLKDMDDQEFCNWLQGVYQLSHEALCMKARVNRTDFENYPSLATAKDEMDFLKLFDLLYALAQCCCITDMETWRKLTTFEKNALHLFYDMLEDVYQYTIGVSSVSAEDFDFG